MSAGLGTFRPQHQQHGKPNTSRLRLTSQMDCNGLINPLFVRLYCILWQFIRQPCCLLHWFAVPREDLLWKTLPAALTAVAPLRMWSGSWAAFLVKITEVLFSPLSSPCIFKAYLHRAGFCFKLQRQCGLFFIYIWRPSVASSSSFLMSESSFILLRTVIASASLFWIYAHFSETSVGLLWQCRDSA